MHAELPLTLGTLYSFLLVLARMGGVFAFVPLPWTRGTPEVVRIAFVLSLTLALYPLWPAAPSAEPGLGRLVLWMTAEAGFGTLIGVAVGMLNESFVLAAQVIGLQAGYAYASTIDPNTEADSNVLQVLAYLWAGMLFFAMGLDGYVIRLFARSLELYPPGSSWLKFSSAQALLELGTHMFSTGLRLALPVISLLLLIDIALALFGRIHAQLQLLMLAFPAKMLTALGLLLTISVVFLPVYRSTAEYTFTTLGGWLAHAR